MKTIPKPVLDALGSIGLSAPARGGIGRRKLENALAGCSISHTHAVVTTLRAAGMISSTVATGLLRANNSNH